MRRHGAPVAILALALGVRLANLWAMSRLPVADAQFQWAESDMQTAYVWSGRILDGDLLGRDAVHQYTEWMRAIAPLATWERWWGGQGVFHQAPLYAYALAAMRLVGGEGFWGIALCQLTLGLANVLLIFLLTERFFGRTAAIAAGLGAALYGPFVLFEAFALRDTFAVTTSLVLLWALERTTATGTGRWLVAGACFALAVLTRETTLLFAPFVALWIVARLRRPPVALARAALAALAGASLAFAPLVARNLAVGVAPWALSTRGVEGFIHGHAAGASAVGFTLPPATRSILERSDGSLATAVHLTLDTWGDDWGGLLRHEVAKLQAIASGYEGADNVNGYYFAERSPALRWSLGFSVVLALGLVGLWAPGARADRRLLVYFLVATLAGLMYGVNVGRYRLVPAAVLWVYAGATVAWLRGALERRHWRTAAGIVAAAALIGVLSARSLDAVETRQRHRAAEFLVAAKGYYDRGQRERSLEELRTGLRSAYRGPDQPELPAGFGRLLEPLVIVAHELGRDAAAAAELEMLVADYPADADLHTALGLVYRDGLGRPHDAEEHLAAARRLRGR